MQDYLMFPAFLCHSAIFMIHTMQDPRFVVFNGGTACINVGFEREIVAIMKYLHAHRLALLVQRFHRHKFITAPAQSILPIMSSSSPNAVAVDLICSACCCNGDATHSSIAPNETVHNIPATSATSAIRKIENPVLRMAVSSLFFDNRPSRQSLPIRR